MNLPKDQGQIHEDTHNDRSAQDKGHLQEPAKHRHGSQEPAERNYPHLHSFVYESKPRTMEPEHSDQEPVKRQRCEEQQDRTSERSFSQGQEGTSVRDKSHESDVNRSRAVTPHEGHNHPQSTSDVSEQKSYPRSPNGDKTHANESSSQNTIDESSSQNKANEASSENIADEQHHNEQQESRSIHEEGPSESLSERSSEEPSIIKEEGDEASSLSDEPRQAAENTSQTHSSASLSPQPQTTDEVQAVSDEGGAGGKVLKTKRVHVKRVPKVYPPRKPRSRPVAVEPLTMTIRSDSALSTLASAAVAIKNHEGPLSALSVRALSPSTQDAESPSPDPGPSPPPVDGSAPKADPKSVPGRTGRPPSKPSAPFDSAGYRCDLCPGERFGRVHDLKRHQTSKHNERTWPCDFCHRPFVRRDALLRHYSVKAARRDGVHPTEQEENRLQEAKARAKLLS
ncbi:hypothetical protein BGZ54_002034 [Gamsiella multidivaricata]|nr:hypothetical protein BGZ54_002034 [Gamsiella multidivaricata]